MFFKSLEFTELSTATLLGNQCLAFYVLYKRLFKKSEGISEVEIRGALWLFVGMGVFIFKNMTIGTGPTNGLNIFQHKSILGYIFAFISSISVGLLFQRNYDSYTKIPKFTGIFFVLFYTVIFLTTLEIVNRYYYPIDMTKDNLLTLTELLSIENSLKSLIAAIILIFGAFALQNEVLKYVDFFMVNLTLIYQPLVCVMLGIFFKFQDLELTSIAIGLIFFIPGETMVLVGMQQFEDRYKGGEIGLLWPLEIDSRLSI